MSYEVLPTKYDRYILVHEPECRIIDSSNDKNDLVCLLKDILKRGERRNNATLPTLQRRHAETQEAETDVRVSMVRA